MSNHEPELWPPEMLQIALNRARWAFDPQKPIGNPGSYGTVFEGRSQVGEIVAVKRLNIDANQSAHREMKVADDLIDRPLEFVITILDYGEDAEGGGIFIVMPKAQMTLQEKMRTGLNPIESRGAMIDIARGLLELRHIVHRDLKPANILSHDARWKIADFGIARFAEEQTSSQTLKRRFSANYAAPEQWRQEQCTNATDIYALGCIGFELLAGHKPFAGSLDDLEHMHLTKIPEDLPEDVPFALRSLIAQMLRKEPGSRPSASRVLSRLETIPIDLELEAVPPALTRAAAKDAREKAQLEADSVSRHEMIERRKRLAVTGRDLLLDIARALVDHVKSVAETARVTSNSVDLGRGRLIFWPLTSELEPNLTPAQMFGAVGWDVVFTMAIQVHGESGIAWSASLYYARIEEDPAYRWYEVAYSFSPSINPTPPADLLNNPELAASALAGQSSVAVVAYGPISIDDEDQANFQKRWESALGCASMGKLSVPNHCPIAVDQWDSYFLC